MKTYGGYLSIDEFESDNFENPTQFAFNAARTSLRFTLQILKPRRIYLPIYICPSVIDVILKEKIECSFVALDSKLEFKDIPHLKSDELIYFVNYFGIKNTYINEKLKKIPKHLALVDNVHSYYNFIESGAWILNSARKFFPVSDGSFLKVPESHLENCAINYSKLPHFVPKDCWHTWGKKTLNSLAYENFKGYEAEFSSEIYKISVLAQTLLKIFDRESAKTARSQNAHFLHEKLSKKNRIDFTPSEGMIYYPFLPIDPGGLTREAAIQSGLFLPLLWPNLFKENEASSAVFAQEKEFVADTLLLPIDQRYTLKEVEEIYQLITKLIFSNKRE